MKHYEHKLKGTSIALQTTTEVILETQLLHFYFKVPDFVNARFTILNLN